MDVGISKGVAWDTIPMTEKNIGGESITTLGKDNGYAPIQKTMV